MATEDTLHEGWTMDSATSRDLDDAIRIERLDTQGWQVHIYIAAPGLELDTKHAAFAQALERRTTRYLPDHRTIPMLSEEMERRHSLLPGERREAMHITCTINADGELLDACTEVTRVQFRSTGRFVYDDPHLHPHAFTHESAFAMRRILARRSRGTVSFVDLERGVYTDEQGQVHKVVRREEVMGHLIVQEAMIVANEALARWCASRGVRVVFRIHKGPECQDTEEQEALDAFVRQAIAQQDAASLDLLDSTFANRLSAAIYSTSPEPHWALQLPMYMHATSPLRRVHDLIAQMQIFAYLAQRPLPLGWHELERVIDTLKGAQHDEEQRDIARFKRRDSARFMRQLLGDDQLSSKQMRQAIHYLLTHPEQADLHAPILARITQVFEEAHAHPSGTAPVSLIDVLLECRWEQGRATALAFLDANESAWKQVRAHAIALRSVDDWWMPYLLTHDPVLHAEQQSLAHRERLELEERSRVEAQRREKRRALDPLARYNDLLNTSTLQGDFTYASHQADGKNQWRGELAVTRGDSSSSSAQFMASGDSKKGVKRDLVTQALAWWDNLVDEEHA